MGGENRGHARIVNTTCEAFNFARRGAMQVRVQRRNNRQRFLEEVALGHWRQERPLRTFKRLQCSANITRILLSRAFPRIDYY